MKQKRKPRFSLPRTTVNIFVEGRKIWVSGVESPWRWFQLKAVYFLMDREDRLSYTYTRFHVPLPFCFS